MHTKRTPINRKTIATRGIVGVALLIFFVITVGAAAGLLGSGKIQHTASSNLVAKNTQLAGVLKSIPTIFDGVTPVTRTKANQSKYFFGLISVGTVADGKKYYERVDVKGWHLRYFPDVYGGRYYIGKECTSGGNCLKDTRGPLRPNSLDVKAIVGRIKNASEITPLRTEVNKAISFINSDQNLFGINQTNKVNKSVQSQTLLKIAIPSGSLPAGYMPGVTKKGKVMRTGTVVVGIDAHNNNDIEYDPTTNTYQIWKFGTDGPEGPYPADAPQVVQAKKVINNLARDIVSTSTQKQFMNSGNNPGNPKASGYNSLPVSTYAVSTYKGIHTAVSSKTRRYSSTKDNRCDTTYVTLSAVGAVEKRSCYGSPSDEARYAISKLATCVANNTRGATTPDSIARIYTRVLPELKAGMCEGPKAITVKSTSNKNAILQRKPLVIYPITTPSIPGACKAQYDKVIWLMGGINSNSKPYKSTPSATLKDAAACTYKGAVVCFQKDPSSPNTLTCKRKADGVVRNITVPASLPKIVSTAIHTAGIDSTNTVTRGIATVGKKTTCSNKISCFIQSILKDTQMQKSFKKLLKSVIAKKIDNVQCPGGYVTASNGDRTCKIQPPVSTPRCAIDARSKTVAAGEGTLLKWKTIHAKSVHIGGITDTVALSGERTIYPIKTTKYTLTAKNGTKEKTCSVTVTVAGVTTGTAGPNPPKLSCAPATILKGTKAKVSWACPSNADRSYGIGIRTNSLTFGETAVSPKYNTEYTAQCFKGNEKIGANTCSVTVGDPQYDILVYPGKVKRGESVRVAWASLFVKSCRVQGPRGFDYTHKDGVVSTAPFARNTTTNITNAVYTLTCQSQFGGTVVKKAVVKLGQ